MVSKRLLAFAANSYGFKKRTLHFISGSTNQIYCFQKKKMVYPAVFPAARGTDASDKS